MPFGSFGVWTWTQKILIPGGPFSFSMNRSAYRECRFPRMRSTSQVLARRLGRWRRGGVGIAIALHQRFRQFSFVRIGGRPTVTPGSCLTPSTASLGEKLEASTSRSEDMRVRIYSRRIGTSVSLFGNVPVELRVSPCRR